MTRYVKVAGVKVPVRSPTATGAAGVRRVRHFRRLGGWTTEGHDAVTQFGTLMTWQSKAAAQVAAGCTVAHVEGKHRELQPNGPGTALDATALANVKGRLQQYRDLGMRTALTHGLHYPPTWLTGGSTVAEPYAVDELTEAGTTVDYVWNAAMRTHGADFLRRLGDAGVYDLVTDHRLGSGGRSEILYPERNLARRYRWYCFGAAPTTGTNLIAGVQPYSAVPAAGRLDWYLGALLGTVTWQQSILAEYGARSFQLLMPGSGATDAQVASAASSLTAGTFPASSIVGVGAAWRYITQNLPAPQVTSVYCTSAANQSSALSNLAGLAQEYGRALDAENPGYDGTTYYKTSMPVNLGADATTYGVRFCYWAHDDQLNNGTMPAATYLDVVTTRTSAGAVVNSATHP